MSGHRPFASLYDALPTDRRRRIDADVESNLREIDRAMPEQEAKFLVYRALDGLFRWRLVTANGETVAESASGWLDRSECLESIERLRAASSTLAVEEAV